MRILLADLNTAVTQALLEIKKGVEDARDAGLVAELPEKVDFTVEIVTGIRAFSDTETDTDNKRTTTEASEPGATTTTQRSAGGQQSTDTQTTTSVDYTNSQTLGAKRTTFSY